MTNFKSAPATILRASDSVKLSGHGRDGVSKSLASAVRRDNRLKARDANAFSSTNSFLVGELEKRDSLIRMPLAALTWKKNIPVRVGGGWDETVTNLDAAFGAVGQDDDQSVVTNGATILPTIQGNFLKDIWLAHMVIIAMSINEYDMEKQKITGRSLDQLLSDGVRLQYEMHMDKNVFTGLPKYGTYGLLNNPNVTATNVAAGGGTGSPLDWAHKTPNEILADINTAINTVWAASGNDDGAIPNHILLPYAQYQLLLSTIVSAAGTESILTFLQHNNICNLEGDNLVFGVSKWNKGAGVGPTDRMVVYRHEERFIAVDELQPLTRRRTMYSPKTSSFDTNFAANISQVEFFYPQAVGYFDGI